MNAIENVNYPADGGTGGNNPVEPDEDESQQQSPDASIEDVLDDESSNNDSTPSEIQNDEVPDLDDENYPREFPRDDSNIGDNPVYPNEDDTVPKNDRIPSEIRNDDSPGNTGI